MPALGSLAAEPLYVLVDTAIVGRLGTAQLGGLALAATVLSLVVAACNFLTYGATERVAWRLGAGRPDEAADVGVQTMWLSVIVGLVVTPIVWLAAPVVGRLLGGTGEVLDFAISYLRIAALGLPFVLITLGAQGVQRGASDYHTPLVILLAANAANAVLEVLFVYGFGWGVRGSAWSTVIVQVVAGLTFAVVVRRHLRPARHHRPSRTGMAPLMRAGRHLLLRVGSMLAVTAAMTAIAARTDEATLAAHQIGASVFIFLALGLDALAIPAQTLVAEELGHGASGATEISHRCVRLSTIAGAILAVLLAALSPVLPHAFSGDPAVVARATAVLLWLAVALVPGAIAFAYDGVLIGAGDYRFLGVAALAYLVAVSPLGIVTLVAGLGIAGIWGTYALWMVLRAACNHWRGGARAGAGHCQRAGDMTGRLLVTGGSGYLGRVVVERAIAAGWDVTAPASSVDVRDLAALTDAMTDADAVVHTAYVRDGPTAREVIVDGTANVVRAAAGRRLVHLSTDVVFDELAAALLELVALDVAGQLHVAGPVGLSRADFATLLADRPVRRGQAAPGRPLDCRLNTTRARSILTTRLRGPHDVLS